MLLYALALSLLISACSKTVLSPSAESPVLSELRSSYRAASIIATVTCMQSQTNAEGLSLATLAVSETLAGDHSLTELLSQRGDMTPGNDYLVYLQAESGQEHYKVIIAAPWDKNADTAAFGNDVLPLSALRNDIAQLQSVISAPAETLYYNNLDLLVEASDLVFIGKVNASPELSETSFREESGAATIEHSRPASIVHVQAYGSIKGALKYDETLSFVYAPAYVSDLIDSTTLTPFACSEDDIIPLEAGYYVFFLKKGPDAKQAYYFGVNPLQSYVKLDKDSLICAKANGALAPYGTLPAMLDVLKAEA